MLACDGQTSFDGKDRAIQSVARLEMDGQRLGQRISDYTLKMMWVVLLIGYWIWTVFRITCSVRYQLQFWLINVNCHRVQRVAEAQVPETTRDDC